jgi:hypothetical protein
MAETVMWIEDETNPPKSAQNGLRRMVAPMPRAKSDVPENPVPPVGYAGHGSVVNHPTASQRASPGVPISRMAETVIWIEEDPDVPENPVSHPPVAYAGQGSVVNHPTASQRAPPGVPISRMAETVMWIEDETNPPKSAENGLRRTPLHYNPYLQKPQPMMKPKCNRKMQDDNGSSWF